MNTVGTISLCVIAKNEEHCLARCLCSVRKLVDEIIVVDTGSTDNTVKIAVEHGASVFSFAWIDDFAAARNYAISKARGVWILVLDADEALSLLSREELQKFMEQKPAEGYYFKICSYLDHGCNTVEDYVVRLFKNAPEYKFSGAIHEQIAGSILCKKPDSGLVFAPFTIEHYGYCSKEIQDKHKFDRNTSIIRKSLIENPLEPFLHYSLGVEYLQNRNFQQAGEVLQQAISLLHGDEGYIPQLLLALLLVKLRQPEDVDAEAWFCKAVQLLPDNGDIYCLHAVWLMQHQRFLEATAALTTAMTKSGDLVDPGRLNALLADAYYFAGVLDQAVKYYTNAFCVKDTSANLYSLERLLTLWSSRSAEVAWEVLWRTLTPEKITSLLQRIRATGQFDLALAVILLAVIERSKVNDMVSLITLGNMYLQILNTVTPSHSQRIHIYAILSVSAEVLLLQGELIQMSCGHVEDFQQALLKGAMNQLALITSLYQEFSAGDSLLFWQEVFLGDACANCQSD